MKKTSKLLTVGCSAVLAVGMLLGAGCSNGAFTDDKSFNALKLTANEVYATSAASGAAFLNSLGEDKPIDGAIVGETPPVVEDTPQTDIGKYIADFESLSGGNIGFTISANADEAYLYEFVMEINCGKESVKMYYDEISSETKTEVADDEDDFDETETVTVIKGVAVYGDEEYTVIGEKKSEIEGSEEEFSIEFRTIKDELNFVEFNYESEKDGGETEISYEFKVVENGVTVAEYEFETEIERGKTQTSYSIKLRTENGVKKYEIKKSSTRENVLIVKREENGVKTETILKKTENGYETVK